MSSAGNTAEIWPMQDTEKTKEQLIEELAALKAAGAEQDRLYEAVQREITGTFRESPRF